MVALTSGQREALLHGAGRFDRLGSWAQPMESVTYSTLSDGTQVSATVAGSRQFNISCCAPAPREPKHNINA
jgi:hypothetical protein